jgi:hypothetical protein
MEDDEVDEEALSQVIEAFVASARAGLKRTATSKVVDNVEQARQAKSSIHRAMHQNTKAIRCEYHQQWWINLVRLDRLDIVKECLDISLP